MKMHASYYAGAHACVLVFDMTRKITYKNLDTWYDELVKMRGLSLPVIVVANKVDADASKAGRTFAFVEKRRAERAAFRNQQEEVTRNPDQDPLPLYFASAADGTNVVRIFQDALDRAAEFRDQVQRGEAGEFVDQVMQFMEEERRAGGLFSEESLAQ